MRISFHQLPKAMRSSVVPKKITQEPFDYDPGHYRRLCDLDGRDPSGTDLLDYALDMTYMEIQPELLRHLMPVLLSAWRRDLFEGSSARFRGFVEQLWPAMLKGQAFKTVLTPEEQSAVIRFMSDSILDRMDAEESLSFSGSGASPYGWIHELVSFGVLFPHVDSIWEEWWRMTSQGHAIAAFQYASALLYEEDRNPVFAPWNPEKGGGPPAIWESGSHLYDVGWRVENIEFVSRTLSADYLESRLRAAQAVIEASEARRIAAQITNDLPDQRALLDLRLEELPELLTNLSEVRGFTI